MGLGDKSGGDCPMSLYHLADALCLSADHVNRVVRDLRERGFVRFQQGRVAFQDSRSLIHRPDFDAAYLGHEGPRLK